MFKLLIFGGTTEGRLLAEYCSEKNIDCDVSVTTDYGASLLPKGTNRFCGRLDAEQMTKLMTENPYSAVADATHPYAADASANIRNACKAANLPYYRLIRDRCDLWGETAESIDEIIDILNGCDDTVLCSLGRKALSALTRVNNYSERLWLRLLPSEDIISFCKTLGYDEKKIICQRGPFTVELNTEHIRLSQAKILLTKESGENGGYPEKAAAARKCGIKMLTLIRPAEKGFSLEELILILNQSVEKIV